jgi:pyruvate,water dikinase
LSLPNPLIIPLDAVRPNQHADLGGKAQGLAELIRTGLPVPPGFCISSQAYRDHVARCGLAVGPGQAERLAELRQAILDQQLSPDLAHAVDAAYRQLGAGAVAVRSSATVEDLPHHSAAGLHDTVLDVSGIADLLAAVKRCWASLWTERAVAYRARNGLAAADVAMAVIVQRLVRADVAGVLFTAHPLTGNREQLTVEGSFGLGEAVVSGKVSPERLVLARQGLGVLEHTTGDQGGSAPLPCLDPSTARRLAELGLRAEAALGGPQDIEWAVAGGAIALLQSRPITTQGPTDAWEDRQVWSNLNTGEVMPDVASPLTWSTIQFILQRVFGQTLGQLGLDFDVNELAGLIAGRAYFNLTTFVGIFQLLPGFRHMDPQEIFGGAQGKLLAEQVRRERNPNLHLHWGRLLRNVPGFLLWILSHSPHRGLQWVTASRRRLLPLQRLDLRALSDEELRALFLFLLDNPRLHSETIGYALVGIMFFSQLFSVCRHWLGDADGSVANSLLAGMGNMDSAESGLALWRLAVRARALPDVRRALESEADFATTRKSLQAVPGGAAFLAGWDAFMEQHGHHTRGEVDVMNPRWSETPDLVLDVLRSYLHQEVGDPLAAHRQRGVERRQLAAACRARLRNPLKRLLFSWVLDQSQRGCRVRENLKSEAVRALALARALFRETGRRLSERGVLGSPEDIFFLRMEEIHAVSRGRAGFDVPATIAARRAEYERNLTLSPPSVVVGRFDPAVHVAETVDTSARLLTGLAVSPGVATGPARVILRSDSREQVLPGEVLVAPFTDPGWTPHFLNAAAIVMDMGGLLSHGSIVAREYGIPAVVNARTATKIIQTGQLLQVDGGRGEVRFV